MRTTQTLIDGLRRSPVQWTFRQLPGGSDNPLVKAEVLKPSSRIQKFVECPDCDECAYDEMPEWYRERDEANTGLRLRFTCPKTMEVKDLPEDWIRIWEYDGDRLAALVSEAMGCEERSPRSSGGFWRLGLMKDAIGKNRRELLVATRLDSLEDAAYKALNGNGRILFVGLCKCKIPDSQVARRVLLFSDVLRFDENGRLSIVRDSIASRFGGEGSPRQHKKGNAESRIAEFLFEYAKNDLLRLDSRELAEARTTFTDEWVSNGSKTTRPTFSRIVQPSRLRNGKVVKLDNMNYAQIYFCICLHDSFFTAFKHVVDQYRRTSQSKDLVSIANKVMAELAQRRPTRHS